MSMEGPTELEKKHSSVLELWCENTVEPEEEFHRRRQALVLLGSVCRSWIQKTYVEEFGFRPDDEVGGIIRTTGSFRYNAHSSGSDIDVVLIAPDRLTIDHFIRTLPPVLRGISAVTDIVVIAEARVPIISMKILGIDFDLLFGSVNKPRVPEEIKLLDDSILIGLTPQSTKAVNGARVAEILIKSVPDVAVFRQVLRFVKSWAKARGIYSFKIGFPSGIGWAILSARICQCYPKKDPAGTLFHFFSFYTQWWSKHPTLQQPNRAIFLTPSATPPVDYRREGVEKSWNPRETAKDARALFPVLTPAYPYQDACDNVSNTTLGVLCDEFARGNEVIRSLKESTASECAELKTRLAKMLEVKRAAENECTVPGEAAERGKDAMKGASFGTLWETLLEPFPLFSSFTHFIRITLATTNPREFRPWVEIMETKISNLWREARHNKGCALENWYPNLQIRPISKTYEDPAQAALVERAKAQLDQMQQQLQQQGGGGGSDNSNSAASSSSSSNANFNNQMQQQVFTAFVFIGLKLLPGAKVATAANPDGINFERSKQAFIERCRETLVKMPSALLPTVDIVRRDALPSWLPGVNAPPAPGSALAAALAATTAAAPAATEATTATTTTASAAAAAAVSSVATQQQQLLNHHQAQRRDREDAQPTTSQQQQHQQHQQHHEYKLPTAIAAASNATSQQQSQKRAADDAALTIDKAAAAAAAQQAESFSSLIGFDF